MATANKGAATTKNDVAKANQAQAGDAGAEVEGVYVRAVSGRRCRAGFCFDQVGQGFANGVLTDEQLAALKDDPLLKVEHGTFTDSAE